MAGNIFKQMKQLPTRKSSAPVWRRSVIKKLYWKEVIVRWIINLIYKIWVFILTTFRPQCPPSFFCCLLSLLSANFDLIQLKKIDFSYSMVCVLKYLLSLNSHFQLFVMPLDFLLKVGPRIELTTSRETATRNSYRTVL